MTWLISSLPCCPRSGLNILLVLRVLGEGGLTAGATGAAGATPRSVQKKVGTCWKVMDL